MAQVRSLVVLEGLAAVAALRLVVLEAQAVQAQSFSIGPRGTKS